MFPGNSDVLGAALSLVSRAVNDGIATGKGIDMPRSPVRVYSVLSTAMASPELKSEATEIANLLPRAIALGASSSADVDLRAELITAVCVPDLLLGILLNCFSCLQYPAWLHIVIRYSVMH